MTENFNTLVTLDRDIALQYAMNNKQYAQQFLQLLLQSFPEFERQIELILEQYFIDQEQANSDLLVLIHKLHGSCIYCGALKLQAICFFIEQQLRRGISAIALFPELLKLLTEFDNIRWEAAACYTD